MRTVLNEALVSNRATRARRVVTLAIAMMLLAVALSFNAQFLLPAYVIVIVGTIMLHWGGRAVGKWIGEPRFDQSLAKALKNVNHGYQLYSYVLPADHVIVGPSGLFVLKVKPHDGDISCRGNKWHRAFRWQHLWRLLSQESLGNPTKQANEEADKARRFLSDRLPDVNVPIRPLVVFIDPNANLEVVDPSVPVLHLRDVKAHLREAKHGEAIPAKTLQALLSAFDDLLD
jgi:hypothetical protein